MTTHGTTLIHNPLPKAELTNLQVALHSQIDEMLPYVDKAKPSAQPLFDLIEQLRPTLSTDSIESRARFEILLDLLSSQPMQTKIFADYLLTLLQSHSPALLYNDIGILNNDGFIPALLQRMAWRVIPPLQPENQIDTLFNRIFHKDSDERWLGQISAVQWHRLHSALASIYPNPELLHGAQQQVLSALMVLSYRITAMGLEPELIRIDPSIDAFESPFMAQNREIIEFVESFQPYYLDPPLDMAGNIVDVDDIMPPDERPTAVMIEQCRAVLQRLRKNTKQYGVSIRLTNLMLRIEQSLARMELLIELLLSFSRSAYIEVEEEGKPKASGGENPLYSTLQILIHEQKYHASIRDLISTNTELMALQVTENASKTGDHYVTEDRKGYFAMMRSAMGAGAIIALMATIKVLLGRVVLAPFIKALTQSMDYSFGFMIIHMLHFTVATKQPAMTAATIAATVHQGGKTRQAQLGQLADLARLTVNIIRTQFIAIIGNISIAMPVGVLIAYLWQTGMHQPLLTPAKAVLLLHDLNPFESLALFHAAIAGVCLFLAGLIAGYYDNLAVYHSVGARLRQHRRLKKMMTPARLDKVSTYIENNLGALAGNFWFGIMLGSMGTIGYILGLPLDIRHIAFASVNFAQSYYTLHGQIEASTVLVSFLGVLMIGMTNLLVSFTLALLVALKARRVSFRHWRSLGRLILSHFATRPTDFFVPPATPPADAPIPDSAEYTALKADLAALENEGLVGAPEDKDAKK
jgi:site-specific recombinase